LVAKGFSDSRKVVNGNSVENDQQRIIKRRFSVLRLTKQFSEFNARSHQLSNIIFDGRDGSPCSLLQGTKGIIGNKRNASSL